MAHPLNPVVPHGVRQALLATLCHTGCCSPSVHDFCQSFLLRLAATPSRLCQMAMRFVPRSAQRRSRCLFACRSRCLFVCEFDPTDRSSLVSPIRQQTIANAPHACMPKPFLGLLLILINHIKIPWARWLQGAVDARWVVVVVVVSSLLVVCASNEDSILTIYVAFALSIIRSGFQREGTGFIVVANPFWTSA